MDAPPYLGHSLAVCQMTVKAKRQELRRTWVSSITAFALLLILDYATGLPWLLWFILSTTLLGVFIWRYIDLSTDIAMWKWQVAYAKAALNEPLEEPKDWSKGRLALLVPIVVAVIGLIAKFVN